MLSTAPIFIVCNLLQRPLEASLRDAHSTIAELERQVATLRMQKLPQISDSKDAIVRSWHHTKVPVAGKGESEPSKPVSRPPAQKKPPPGPSFNPDDILKVKLGSRKGSKPPVDLPPPPSSEPDWIPKNWIEKGMNTVMKQCGVVLYT